MTDDKLYTSLSANTIMAKLTNHFQRTRFITLSTNKHYSLDSEDDPLRLPKRQSPTTVLFRTTLTRTTTLYEQHFLNLSVVNYLVFLSFFGTRL